MRGPTMIPYLLNPLGFETRLQKLPYLLEEATDTPIEINVAPGTLVFSFVASGGAGGADGTNGNGGNGGTGGAGGTPTRREYHATLTSATTLNIYLGEPGTITDGNGGKTQNTGTTAGNAGGAAKPTYIKINGTVSMQLFAWGDESDIVLYSLDEIPRKNDLLFTTTGGTTNEWTVVSATANELTLTNNIGGETYTLERNNTLDGTRTVTNPVLWSLGGSGGGGGGGGGGSGENSGSHAGEGAPGGGYYRFYPATLTTESVPGQNATAVKGAYSGSGNAGTAGNTDDFPDAYSGYGGDSLHSGNSYSAYGGNGAYGGGASGGAGSNHEWNHGTSVRGWGGGGAPGGDDAHGGNAGYSYPGHPPSWRHPNTPSKDGSNPGETATMSIDYLGNESDKGRGGNNNEDGHTGWIYIIRK